MRRTAALSRGTVGTERLWMGLTDIDAGQRSAPHHHGHSEIGIYVVTGTPTFSFRVGGEIVEIDAEPGDFVHVPPYVPHIESIRGDVLARVVIARTTDEAIVENLEGL